MSSPIENGRNANAERQGRWRLTPVGIVIQALRAADRKVARQLARRRYHSERRAAVVGSTPGGERLRDVGISSMGMNAAELRSRKIPPPLTNDELIERGLLPHFVAEETR